MNSNDKRAFFMAIYTNQYPMHYIAIKFNGVYLKVVRVLKKN